MLHLYLLLVLFDYKAGVGNSNGAKACKKAVGEGVSAALKTRSNVSSVVGSILAIGEINLPT